METSERVFSRTKSAEASGAVVASAARLSMENRLSVAGSLRPATSRREMLELAFSEMEKRRRRLGELTIEQEQALAALIETLVARFSLMFSAVGLVEE